MDEFVGWMEGDVCVLTNDFGVIILWQRYPELVFHSVHGK